jgi:hypothetical protein
MASDSCTAADSAVLCFRQCQTCRVTVALSLAHLITMRYYAAHPSMDIPGFTPYATVLGLETKFNTAWWLVRPESQYARSASQTLMDMYTSSGRAPRARWIRCRDVIGSASSEVKKDDLLWFRKATGKVYTQQ